jgi:thiamine pyrophosphokinase
VRVAVVLNGDPISGDVAHVIAAELVVAADGGANWLARMGIRPDLVVGDLDSIDAGLLRSLEEAGSTVERHPAEKDASDGELAVRAAWARGAREVSVVGGLGARPDHELSNVGLLAADRPAGSDLRLVRGSTTVRLIRPGNQWLGSGIAGDTVSLVPYPQAAGITTGGLRYPLRGEELAAGTSRGLSNEVIEPPATVTVEEGLLLAIEIAGEENS